jgi:hypothetical protein
MANFLRSAKNAAIVPENWKATASAMASALFAALTVISGLSYDQGPMALIIPPTWKPLMLKISGGATVALFLYSEYQKALIRNQTTKQLKHRR